MAGKTICPVSRNQFVEGAKPVEVIIDGNKFSASVKEFSTGSLGWYLNGKTSVQINGVPVAVQIGLNLTIVGSKELPKSPGSALRRKRTERKETGLKRREWLAERTEVASD